MADRQSYIQMATVFDSLRGPMLAAAIQALQYPQRSHGLDAGCGIGLQAVSLANVVGPAGHITGLDLSAEFLDYAEDLVQEVGLSERITFREGDVRELPFDDDSFDWAWSVDCVGYSPIEPLPLLKELARVVKPGGEVVTLAWSYEKLLPGYPLLEAQVDAVQRDNEAYQDGSDPDAVAMTEARLKNADAHLKVARNALEGITITAPVSGSAVSADIIPGDTVLPSQTVITLADLSELRVETTDLSERDVAQVSVGQKVSVYIEALNVVVPGRVVRISPQADVIGGDVVYAVIIDLDEQPPGLRWGMSVEIAFEE